MNKKTKRIYLRVSEKQYNFIKETAKKNNMTMTNFILFNVDVSNKIQQKQAQLLIIKNLLHNLNVLSNSDETNIIFLKNKIKHIIDKTNKILKQLNLEY